MNRSTSLKAAQFRRRAFAGPAGWVEGVGLGAYTLASCFWHYLRVVLGREPMDIPAFAAALRQAGLSVLPALTLVSLATGAIIGRQIQSLLGGFDLPGLVVLPVTYGAIIELVPLLVGILVAGRAGVALAVRQAKLTASGEVDGLLVSGIDPIRFTVAPVLLAMLLMSFAFAVWAALATYGAVFLWLWLTESLPPALFIDSLVRTLAPSDLLSAVIKPVLFALLIAPIATINGTAVGRDPEGIAEAATGTMIGAVAAILLADLAVILLLP